MKGKPMEDARSSREADEDLLVDGIVKRGPVGAFAVAGLTRVHQKNPGAGSGLPAGQSCPPMSLT